MQFKNLQMTKRQSVKSSENSTERFSMMTSGISKLSKRKKAALKLIDKNLMARISDYFSCWKLKVLLEEGASQVSWLDETFGQADCSLD